MGKNYDEIAMRDQAEAALMGALPDDFGTEDAYEPDQFGSEDVFGVEFGDEDDDGGMESIFGAALPPAPPAAINHPDPRVRKILHHHYRRGMVRDARLRLLEPNRGSDLKVERYTFSVYTTIAALATPSALGPVSNSPDVNFRPQRVTCNAPSPAFVLISDARVANVSFTVGGLIDAWQWSATAVGESLDVPTLTPANRATFTGNYTGLVPSPLSGTGAYTFIMSFTGPASIVA